MPKKHARPKSNKVNKKPEKEKQKDWPVVVYIWAIGLFIAFWLIGGEAFFGAKPHPIHWLVGLVGGLVGIPVGWLWYRWRGDVF